MRLSLWLFYSPLLAGLVLCHPVEYPRTTARNARDLLGLLGEDANSPPNAVTPTVTSVQTLITPASTTGTTGETHIPPTRVRTTAASTMTSGAVTYEITPPLTTASATSSSLDPSPGGSTSLSVTLYAPGVLEDASTTPPAELKQWKVIGIAVISITFLAIIAMAISFFDAWWGFVRAAICGKARKPGFGGETMVPNWEKRSWEFQLANEDGHRYPTLASLESIVKEKEKTHAFGAEGRGGIASPDVAYGW